ncbi:recombinase family protein [Shimia sp. MMG029]|uniref:recombinase family protein n=1 Tax=Shimia sp. MMG029 TaxID=3021978 RepID=UPI0022FE43F0|nr:recombinase family protein [Shimia sp. MMG029]MDA5556061.1 recombinase family protein [Shimia sp. MMG029]
MTQKAIIYARVSSRAQASEGHGLSSQEARCRDYAASKGWEVVATFPDTISGGIDFMKRPGMVALLSFLDAQPNENFVVIFDDPKRFARSTRFHIDLRDALRERGAQIACLNFKFDDSPEGEFIETIIAAQGELERKQNGRQVGQKMRARMESGYWIHTAPVGYRYVTVKGRGKMLEPNPPFDGIVREAIEGYAAGRFETQAEVARFLESFPNYPHLKDGKLKQQRVTDMLTHAIYTGHICSERYGIHWLKAQHEPLISLETFDKVQQRRSGSAKAPKRKNIGDHFALRGIAVCDCCEVPLRSSITKGNGGHYAYYLCQTKGCEAYGKSIKRDQLEGDVGEIIKALQPDQSVVRLLTDMFRHIWYARRAQAADIKKDAQSQVRAIDKKIEALVSRILTAQTEAIVPVYEAEIVSLEHDKARLTEKMQKQVEPKGSFEEKLEPALAFLANPWKLWETPGGAQVHLRRLVLKLAFGTRIKYCRNQGARTPEISFPFKALEGFYMIKCQNGAGGGT